MRSALVACACSLALAGGVRAGPPDPDALDFFEKKIRPVLAEHCYRCHSQQARKNKKLKGGLHLDSEEGLRKGGESGVLFVPGRPSESLLLKALRQTDELKMPPGGKLPSHILADFEKWIAQGAAVPQKKATTAAHHAISQGIDWQQARKFWAFQAPRKYALPKVEKKSWPRKDIDVFLLAEIEKRKLRPVRPAAKADLIRRATFDLIGLPPTPEEVDTFLRDEAPDAFARVVDRLLQSPHYGERWGRYWLDVARYADDKALATSLPRPHSYRYRTWVIQAFNQDMPYDQFLRLQIAGDLIKEPADPFIRLAGLGFQGLGAEYHRGNFTAQVMADELDDRIDTLSRGLLGLTVACARCHDHKYDPIPTVDYYSLAAAYQGSTLTELPAAPPDVVARHDAWQKEVKTKEEQLKKWLQQHGSGPGKGKSIAKDAAKTFGETDRKIYESKTAELNQLKQKSPPAPLMIHGITGGGNAMRIHIRGNVERLGAEAPPGFLHVLPYAESAGRITNPSHNSKPQFTRLDLANVIASSKNPLTARVYVNRVWQHHFGRGIVGTASNFGKIGDAPTHPELLDTLAVRFVESGWSTKWLHREIMLSATYQMSTTEDPTNAARDVENRYLWRMRPRRLDLEAWRDAVLAVSGRLDRSQGGPSVDLGSPANVRRTVYARVSRAVPNPMATLFDFPDANATSEARNVTTVPQQQLFVLNSPFMLESAKAFAARLAKAEPQQTRRLGLAYKLAFGRRPTDAEQKQAMDFVNQRVSAGDQLTLWEQCAQAILSSNEFNWVD